MRRGSPRWFAEFESGERVIEAARRLRAQGHRGLEIHAPYDLPGADEVLGHERPRWLPRLVLACALLGAATGYGIQWYTNAIDYPLVVGSRPIHAPPAFVPIGFETLVLFGSFGAFLGWLVGFGAGRLWQPMFEIPGIERASDDRYWLAVSADDPGLPPGHTPEALEALDPLRIVDLGTPR